MENNILLLHVGTGKTGTTALQEFLALNRSYLEECGWCYPDLRGEYFGLHSDVKNGSVLNESIELHWSEFSKRKLWRIILSYLKNYNVIISDEALWNDFRGFSTGEKIVAYKQYYPRVKVVVYLRRQDFFVESTWNQIVKGGNTSDGIEVFSKSSPYAIQSTDYLNKLKEIADVIGKENIIVRIFEKEQFFESNGKKDVISDFVYTLNQLGCNLDHSRMLIPDKLANERLKDEALSFALLFNQEYQKVNGCPFEAVTELFNTVNTILNQKDIGMYFPESERAAFLNRFSNDNEVIAKEYLKRENGILFRNQETEIPIWLPRTFSENEHNQIALLAKLMARCSERINVHKKTHPRGARYYFDLLYNGICKLRDVESRTKTVKKTCD